MSHPDAAPTRDQIPAAMRWNLEDIFEDFAAWERGHDDLAARITALAAHRGHLSQGPARLATLLTEHDTMEVLAHRVWWYPALMHDQDLRENSIEERKQRVALLLARANTETAWIRPEILALGEETVQNWLEEDEALGVYRFFLEDLFRQQDHVLDEDRETLLSYAGPLGSAPADAYTMLCTADVQWPTIELTDGRSVQITYAAYSHLLQTERDQENRRRAFNALYETFTAHRNTYAALYSAVCHRDWFHARSRGYASTLDAALFTHAIPPSVVENLVETTREGVEPLQRYYQLRRRLLEVEEVHLYDGSIPLLEDTRRYAWEETVEHVLASVAPLGAEYTAKMREAFAGRWVDVLENAGKRSGAYSAPVYGVHPYVLLNHKETRGDLFTVAHEMGHSLHTVLSHESQPFVYSNYTIFVAEVASTLNEALLLDHLVRKSEDPRERVLLLQHAIDSIVATFYTQVLFADFELRAHRAVERGEPLTADVLDDLYGELLESYYGDAIVRDDLYRSTWARIPHLFRTPYYVYQYATCFASAAVLRTAILEGADSSRRQAVDRYLGLLRSGGSDHPMEQLRRAGVDLGRPEPVRAVVRQLAERVLQLENEIEAL